MYAKHPYTFAPMLFAEARIGQAERLANKHGMRGSRARREAVIPLHELLSRIHWDPEFGRGEFRLGYYDRLSDELVYVPLAAVRQAADSHFNFELTDGEGVVHSVPYHRVKEVWKDGVLIWQRVH